jgi:hypothetical protein
VSDNGNPSSAELIYGRGVDFNDSFAGFKEEGKDPQKV